MNLYAILSIGGQIYLHEKFHDKFFSETNYNCCKLIPENLESIINF